VERLKPWHTLTGRMHFFLDHDWMRDLGETLPTVSAAAGHAPALWLNPTLGA
jgi:nitrate reductase alpha subunit